MDSAQRQDIMRHVALGLGLGAAGALAFVLATGRRPTLKKRLTGGDDLPRPIPTAPKLLDYIKSDCSRCVDFFLGLQCEAMSEDMAAEFVEKLRGWGGLYPKLTQRLRRNKDIVKNAYLREAAAKVMENNRTTDISLVIEHICKHFLPTPGPNDVQIVRTLGTGSVAQVVMATITVGGKEETRVLKMTFPEVENSFIRDFSVFEWWVSKGWIVNFILGHEKGQRFQAFLTSVLEKRHEIMSEFDLAQEAKFTKEGKRVVDMCTQELVLGDRLKQFTVKVPDVTLHSPHLLEQEKAGGTSVLKLQQRKLPKHSFLMSPEDSFAALASRNATFAYLELFVPMLGHMLLKHGFAHADAHTANLFYDATTSTLWVIDWGAVVKFDEERRNYVKRLIVELGVGLYEPIDMEKATAASNAITGSNTEIALWKYLFDPAKNDLPKDFDVDEYMKSIKGDPQLVLLFEILAQQGQLIKATVEKMIETGVWSSAGMRKSAAQTTLLQFWDTVASQELLQHLTQSSNVQQAQDAIEIDGLNAFALYSDSEDNGWSLAEKRVGEIGRLLASWEKTRPFQHDTLKDRPPRKTDKVKEDSPAALDRAASSVTCPLSPPPAQTPDDEMHDLSERITFDKVRQLRIDIERQLPDVTNKLDAIASKRVVNRLQDLDNQLADVQHMLAVTLPDGGKGANLVCKPVAAALKTAPVALKALRAGAALHSQKVGSVLSKARAGLSSKAGKHLQRAGVAALHMGKTIAHPLLCAGPPRTTMIKEKLLRAMGHSNEDVDDALTAADGDHDIAALYLRAKELLSAER